MFILTPAGPVMAIQLIEKTNDISQQVVNEVLGVYLPNFQILRTIELDYPYSTGTFEIPNQMYTNAKRPGLSGVASVLLMNQAVISHFLTAVLTNDINIFQDKQLTVNECFQLGNNLLITKYQARFKKIVTRNQDFSFTINFDSVKKIASKGMVFIKGTMNICNDSHIIEFSGVYHKNKDQLITIK